MTVTSPVATDTVLSMQGVSKRFGAVQALKDIELDVCAGEVVALVGDNGAGKSTLVKTIAGVYSPDEGDMTFDGRPVRVASPAEAQHLGIATVFQDLALCDNLDVVGNLFLGRELRHHRALDEVEMERQSWQLLRQLSAKIPSVRIPVASLSGGQRQTVAIARSLLGEPKVVMLDEPTAALGVAQTAEVLNLVERLRERGLGVILISHNMADVMAVADRVAVLRLGRNNGVFDVSQTTSQDIIAAITGATSNPVSRAGGTSYVGGVLVSTTPSTPEQPGGPAGIEEMPAAVPADLQDERLIASRGVRGAVSVFTSRLRSGDLGSLPVVVGLIIIWGVFQSLNSEFLSARNLVNLALQSAAVGTIAIGIVLVLLLGEIDLSIGSVSGLAAAIMGVTLTGRHWPLGVAVIAAILTGTVIGLAYGVIFTRFGVPSFVITLAGLLGILGLQLLRPRQGGVAQHRRSPRPLVEFAQQQFLAPAVAYGLVVLIAVAYLVSRLRARGAPRRRPGCRRHRRGCSRSTPWRSPSSSRSRSSSSTRTAACRTCSCCSSCSWWSWTWPSAVPAGAGR